MMMSMIMSMIFVVVTNAQPPYPGPDYLHPKIHHSPNCLHEGGWHDMAGSITTSDGTHHTFQGCPGRGGWAHSTSKDLVHWTYEDLNVHQIHETYEGMDSESSPCSGFVTIDEKGVPCAGFRQCGSSKGTTELNPSAHSWDVPMEMRCSLNGETMTNWTNPIWMYQVYYYRALPYDPVRPWKDYDGLYYSAFSTDACNATTKQVPCAGGGQLEILVSESLYGSWKQLEPMFSTNTTKSGMKVEVGSITREFVTSGYFGNLEGDPDNGLTRVVTQNNYAPTFWVGKQVNGSRFEPYWDRVGAVGHYDYGSLTMARTLGGDANQVVNSGRKILLGWIGGGSPASQSLPRELSLSNDYELLQRFVPELEQLRIEDEDDTGSLQIEILAIFEWEEGHIPSETFGVSVLNGTQLIGVNCSGNFEESPCMGFAGDNAMGPILPVETNSVTVHIIVDHQIIESIFNNRTAMVTYATPSSETQTAVSLFGTTNLKSSSIQTWKLRDANNF